jgi:hypothetical protein
MASDTKKASLILDNMVWQKKTAPITIETKCPEPRPKLGPRKQIRNDCHLTI